MSGFKLALDWTRTLKAKPSKCRTLAYRVFKPGETTNYTKLQSADYSNFDPLLKIDNELIKFIGFDDIPVFKYLGRKFQADLNVDLIISEITLKIKSWLQLVDATPLTGPMKAWIVNHHVCSKLAWPLLIYDFPNTQARSWQAIIQPFYRRWVGLAASAEASVLYRSHEHFGLNFKHLGDMLKRLQVVRWHILKYSNDPLSRGVYAHRLKRDQDGHIGKGRKSSPCLELEKLESEVKVQEIIGKAQSDKKGLGWRRRYSFKDINKEKRHQIGLIMRRDAESKRLLILQNYEMQNSWMSWGLTGMMMKDLAWNKILTGYSEKL